MSRAPLSRMRRAALLFAAFLAAILFADVVFPPPLKKAGETSRLVLDREGRWVHAFATKDGRWRFHADLDAIDPVFVERVIAVEDKRFWRHMGVDPAAVLRALGQTARAGEVVSGASTITMQTARLLEPRPRTIVSKAVEMFRALQIECRLSKREILELYLTLAPYGGNIEGVRAASLSYFGHEPAHLSDAEQALLIALPQSPEARRPDRRPRAARAARDVVLKRLASAGLIDAKRAEEGTEASISPTREVFARAAYHLTRELAEAPAAKTRGDTRSSLDLRMQSAAERLASDVARRQDDGATVSLLIVDRRTMGVRAAVGSALIDRDGGWMDLTESVRSPGSTLKPIIYGLAFDEGLAGPDTVIEDMPQSFDGYAPENFDRAFRGEVKVADALQHSLNVPAVAMLDRLGAGRLSALLRAAGVKLFGPRRADGDFGLTLALGGAGVSMREIATLYAGLANGGMVRPLALTVEDEMARKDESGFRLISPESTHRIAEILRDAPAIEGRSPSALSTKAPRIAFKTGTSYGYRDAWAAGFAGPYAAVVWVGRADGASRPGETGRKAAAPLLFDLFDAIARIDPSVSLDGEEPQEAKMSIARLSAPRRATPPEIVFPRNGVELFASADGAGVALAARGGSGDYRWYVAGEEIRQDASGRAFWRPAGPGFYEIRVVDAAGRTARSKIRVAAG